MRQFIRIREPWQFMDKTVWKQIKKERHRLRRKKRYSDFSQYNQERREEAFSRAANHRLNPTKAEIKFRDALKAREINHVFQHVMFLTKTSYRIADFYLPDHRVIIEIDGSSHDIPKIKAYDDAKDKQTHIKVIRFKNESLDNPTFFQNLFCTVLKKQQKIEPYRTVKSMRSINFPKYKKLETNKNDLFQFAPGYSLEEIKKL